MGSFVITLREGFEAALIVGLILAYLTKTGYKHEHGRTVWWGVALAVGLSLVIGGVLFATVGEFIGVGREGLETALFLFASTKESGAVVAVLGALLGLVAAVVLGVLFYRGALKLDLRKFFTVTSLLVIAFAAFLLYSGLHEFGELAGSEALELVAPLSAVAYGAGFVALYLRDALRTPTRAAAEPAPQAEH